MSGFTKAVNLNIARIIYPTSGRDTKESKFPLCFFLHTILLFNGDYMISQHIDKITGSPTMAVAAKAKNLQAQGIEIIDLSVGEPDFPTPDNVKDAAVKAIAANHTKYTINAGLPALRKAVAESINAKYGLDYTPAEVIISSGAKHSLFNLISALIYIDDEVIIPAPYWVSYPEMVTLAHGKSVILETSAESGFKINPADLEKAITPKTKLLVLCNPSNPTGTTYTRDELLAIANIVKKAGIFVVSDEIYSELVYDGMDNTCFATLLPELRNKTILVNGVSKSHAMTGWRIGWTLAPEPIVKAMDKLQSHSTSNAASISQYAALEAVVGPQDSVRAMQSEFEKRRDYFFDALTAMKEFKGVKPQGAFYLFLDVSAFFGKSFNGTAINNSIDVAMFLLNEANVAAVPGSAFGAEGFMRFSYATSMENLQKAIAKIKAAIAKL